MGSAQTQQKSKAAFAGYSPSLWVRKILVYVLGMFILAMGVSVSVKTNLGISPLNALPYVVSRVLQVDQGIIVTVLFSLYVLAQIAILRKDFKLINLLQFICSVLFGYFVSLCNRLLGWLVLPNYPLQLLFMVLSILLLATGITLYMAANIVPLSSEGLIMAIQQKTGRKFSTLKTIMDCTLVLLAFLASVLTGNGIMGLREGTVVTAICLGPTIGFLSKHIGGKVRVFCNGPSPQAN